MASGTSMGEIRISEVVPAVAPRSKKLTFWLVSNVHVPAPVRASVLCTLAPKAKTSAVLSSAPLPIVRLLFRVSVPDAAPAPASRLPPSCTVTAPFIVPVPPRTAPLDTVAALAALPLMIRPPAVT